jgi:TonB family protein
MATFIQDSFVDNSIVMALPHSRLPRLDLGIDWIPRWEEFRTSLRGAVTGPKPSKKEAVSGGAELSVEWIRSYRPGSSLLAAIVCQVAALWLITGPIWKLLPQTEHTLAPVQIEMSWYAPGDLHPISLPAPTPKQNHTDMHANDVAKPTRGADAFHPRQTILSTPVRLTHPRQTLIEPDRAMQAPKIVEQMPNIVEWAAPPELKRPTIEYSASASTPELRRMQRRSVAAPKIADTTQSALNITQSDSVHLAPPAPLPSAAVPVAPSRTTQREYAAAPQISDSAKSAADLNIGQTGPTHLAPPAPIPSAAVPVALRRGARVDSVAPEIGGQASGNPADLRRLVALSAKPAPPAAETKIPQGNLAANISISPEGTKPGSPGGAEHGGATKANASGNSGEGSLPAAISVSPSSAKAVNGGLAHAGDATPNLSFNSRIPSGGVAGGIRSGPANVAALPAGAAPEKLLSGEVYTLHASTPNSVSTRGSWILHFAQLGADPRVKTQLSGPLPIRTVDPKYPPETMAEHIDGEVVLYAIIRKDGSVDSIQLVRGLDPRLDKAAMDALAQWKFQPGARAGEPVDLEAVVHVPFEYRKTSY